MSHPLIRRAEAFGTRTALVSPRGTVGYDDLLERSAAVAVRLLMLAGPAPATDVDTAALDLHQRPVAYLVEPGWEYVAVQWGIWRAGGMAVPLSPLHPVGELRHVLEDARPGVVIADEAFLPRIREAWGEGAGTVASTGELLTPEGGHIPPKSGGGGPTLPDIDPGRASLMLYTSGTTGRPKGVVLTHGNVLAQVRSMVEAWEWDRTDRILTHLPLHHVHGIVNVLCTALWSGAFAEIQPRFDAEAVWDRLAEGDLTLYMAVPTVYHRLVAAWEQAEPWRQRQWAAGARRCRLMVSGSAALPVPTLERWESITGHRLLERYGMTEIGMALSNPLHGERRPGFVGSPMPGVQARLVDDTGAEVPEGTPGEIQVRGPGVFREYWKRSADTRAAMAAGGWFRTGDEAVIRDGAWRILGRRSVDILKTGGEKISALEIEDVLRLHPGVDECAVVGVDDPEWGDRVCAAVVPRTGVDGVTPDGLRRYLRQRLAPYKVPKEFRFVDTLPSNAMGKVNKPTVRTLFGGAP